MRLYCKFSWQAHIFFIIDVNIDEQLLHKLDELTAVSCRRKFDFNNLWDPAP